ncbi:DUF2169 family type VI secretion system accessory protein [Gilvimarinus sp. F26214L]|uniref:DUF2169 family type VI secretion system accessory protein n=1 Tax=Gilvimarinus sp. DZF01 TaxID=3461371 RepID=UPI0040453A0F
MLEIRDNTPFSTKLMPALDKDGYNYAAVIIKGTFDIRPHTPVLVIADEQVSALSEDVFYGEPGKSSLQYEADVAWNKPGVDIVLNGHAYAPGGRAAESVAASLQVGKHRHLVNVIGDRFWRREGLHWQPTSPAKFQRMALRYENAFGGAAETADDSQEFYKANPVGKGFAGARGQGLTEGLALPNLEHPTQPISQWDDTPQPMGFGFIGRNWQPRINYAGTYDEQWRQQRFPLLPLDFDDRFHCAAHPGLRIPEGMADGERVFASNLSESGSLTIELPRYRFRAIALIKGKSFEFAPVLDTVVIEPDDLRVLLTWRIAIPCARNFLYVDRVTVHWRAA